MSSLLYGGSHVPQNDYSSDKVQTYKYGHTLSLNSHNEAVSNVVRPRSSFVLANRGACYPALPPDTTFELVQETVGRRVAHRQLMSANNGMGVFRKDAKPESTSDYFSQKHIVRNFLNDLHQPLKKTLSRRPVTTGDMPGRDKGHEDFIDPADPVNKRQTGYNKGHIRSMLELDTYGPNRAESTRSKRDDGSLPASPNTDRFSTGSPPRGGLEASPPGSRHSRSSQSLMNSTSRSALHSSVSRRNRGAGGQMSARRGNMFDELSGKADSVDTLTQIYGAYTAERNPRSKGRNWFQSYQNNKKEKTQDHRARTRERQYRDSMQQEADITANNLDDFEARLRTIKRY